MPLSNIVILTAMVSAFIVFGLALAWGEHRTRHLTRRPTLAVRERSRSTATTHQIAGDVGHTTPSRELEAV